MDSSCDLAGLSSYFIEVLPGDRVIFLEFMPVLVGFQTELPCCRTS
jgi:hypothetical protein